MCCVWLTFNEMQETKYFDSSREIEQNIPLLLGVQLCWQDPSHRQGSSRYLHFTDVTAGSSSASRHPHCNQTSGRVAEKPFASFCSAARAACLWSFVEPNKMWAAFCEGWVWIKVAVHKKHCESEDIGGSMDYIAMSLKRGCSVEICY